jgi:hypothetical protein
MVDSVPGPWISDYLINLGEQYGGELSRIPLFAKRKKVRLTEVSANASLNHLSANPIMLQVLSVFDSQSFVDVVFWAKVSDTLHEIPIRISEDCMKAYNK